MVNWLRFSEIANWLRSLEIANRLRFPHVPKRLLIFLLITGLLLGIAIYVHVAISILSLPIWWLTFLTIFLPILVALNAIFFPRLHTLAAATADPWRIVGIILESLLGVFTTVLATLFAANAIPSDVVDCILATAWEALAAFDLESLIGVQDSLNCCGFKTVDDRAWPPKGHKEFKECAEKYGRTAGCREPWGGALSENAWLDFFVTLAAGILELLTALVAEEEEP